MITSAQVSWGKYQKTEGPWIKGTKYFTLPKNPDEQDRWLQILQATEGCLDSVNCYDTCIVSISSVQLCEKFYLASRLLGRVAENCDINIPLQPALTLTNSSFKKNSNGLWRFFFNDERGEVNNIQKQQQLFLGCDGKIGNWTSDAKQQAKLFASCLSNVWEDQRAVDCQRAFIKSRFTSFMMSDSKKTLFDGTQDQLADSLRALYVSFTCNNPTHANNAVMAAVKESHASKWSYPWCIDVLRHLTFDSNIAIYPGRYEKVASVVNTLYDVQFPLKAKDLVEQVVAEVPEVEIVH